MFKKIFHIRQFNTASLKTQLKKNRNSKPIFNIDELKENDINEIREYHDSICSSFGFLVFDTNPGDICSVPAAVRLLSEPSILQRLQMLLFFSVQT